MIFLSGLEMSARIVEILYSFVGGWFTGGNRIPWRDSEFVASRQREYDAAHNESAGSSDEQKRKTKMSLCAALVHSQGLDDVQRGIEMLGDPFGSSGSQGDDSKDKIYLAAVGYYRSEDYSRSTELIDHYLRDSPNSSRALNLKRAIDDEAWRAVHGSGSDLPGIICKGALASAGTAAAGGIASAIKKVQKKKKN